MSETTENRSPLGRLGRWVAELVLVFVGVYAAFWLNNYQQHQQEVKRHDQILAVLENELREGIAAAKTESAREDPIVAEFDRALAAGEMPPLRPFAFVSDYIATLLQSGGSNYSTSKRCSQSESRVSHSWRPQSNVVFRKTQQRADRTKR